ncbi:MAG: transcription-repair coupling factor [Oscillospiraceae bacterium]|jgi:transcription-repair coupling factor (superfamily II helicase)|nr:transcription-repair coupling factor [Oscillospiraceae bacterium]
MQTLTEAIFLDKNLAALPTYVEGGALPALIVGPGEPARATLCAALRERTKRPVFIICADEAAAGRISGDLERVLGETPLKLLERDFNFYGAEGVSRDAERARLATLSSLAEETAGVVVSTVSALLQRTAPKERLLKAVLRLQEGGEISPEAAEAALLRCGYSRSFQVEAPGQFSRRGGILDFYSPAYEKPVRCEFWGDEIDSLGFFEPDAQRRTERITHCEVLPACEILPALGDDEILGEKLWALIKTTEKQGKTKLAQTLREDAEKLSEGLDIAAADRYADQIYPEFATAIDYIHEDAIVFLDSPGKISESAAVFARQQAEAVTLLIESGLLVGKSARFTLPWESAVLQLERFAVIMGDSFITGRQSLEPRSIINALVKQLPGYGGSLETALDDVRHYAAASFRTVVLASDARRAALLAEKIKEAGLPVALDLELSSLPEPGCARVALGSLSAGFELPDARFSVLTDNQLLGGGLRRHKKPKKSAKGAGIASYMDLTVGDLVVHEHHGLGRFAGIFKMPVDGVEKDYIKISYAGSDSLYVPATALDLVSKYIGGGGEDRIVRLNKLGGTDWARAKSRAKAAAKELAQGLVKLYAERSRLEGHAFAPDSTWQTEFEEHFGWQETEDQLRCSEEIKRDMEKSVPMDRLLCGDVGYGKTEVALRAVMKCLLDGKQAAILVPTTVLAQQHFQTAMQRFHGFPVEIELLNRYRTPAQVRQTLTNLKLGKTDLVIGTHRLLQKDVVFKSLGLLVVDEEQRFGVGHKERLKEMSRQVDCLTLTATPIPRTLNMALSGLRDMSTIEEPPRDRQPVQTYVMEHDWGVVCDALRREIARGGQAYYIHNRIETIDRAAARLRERLPDARFATAHGKMDEQQLSGVMESFVGGEIQILVCTTIIETGMDIPNVNTLIIEDADKLGLAQLHQLRGRVGRSTRRASAYLTFRKDKVLTEIAEKRLGAIREFAEFNSGFKIAMRDLEIRGAGNLLGAEQSGHLTDVGYDMYLRLLEEAVLEERGLPPRVRSECSADISVSANLPDSYVESQEQRMDLYRRIALIRTEEEADDMTDELIDRFGEPPSPVIALINVALLRGEAAKAGIIEISQKEGRLRFTLAQFDLETVSALEQRADYKGRLKVEPAAKPTLSLKLRSNKQIIEQARRFIKAYAEARITDNSSLPPSSLRA